MTLVTMRPSDVPTYVEAGAADLGITGKDVLMEQRDRIVYEFLDLGYGACTMVLAGRRGDERLGESERRLGAMRIATKYPRTAHRYFEATGRQAEVIEVKGSVELAPLVGLADGIVDLVDTGRTLAENNLVVREEIARCTARLVGNRVAHKLRPDEVDELAERAPTEECEMRVERIEWDGRAAGRLAGAIRAARPNAEEVGPAVAEIIREVADRGDEAVRELTRRLDGVEVTAGSIRADRELIKQASEAIPADVRASMELAAANIRTVAEAELAATFPVDVELSDGGIRIVDPPVDAAGVYVPGRRRIRRQCSCAVSLRASPASAGSPSHRRRARTGR